MAEVVGVVMAKASGQPVMVVVADLPVAAMVFEPAEWATGDLHEVQGLVVASSALMLACSLSSWVPYMEVFLG
jgi:hypothetical protein